MCVVVIRKETSSHINSLHRQGVFPADIDHQ